MKETPPAPQTALRLLPRSAKNHRLCLEAVKRDGMELYHVPKPLRTRPILFAAVSQNARSIRLLDDQTICECPELLERAIGRNGQLLAWAVERFPELITARVCELAVNSHGQAITAVPKQFLNAELVRTAVMRDGHLVGALSAHPGILASLAPHIPIKHLPDTYKSYAICREQVAQQGRLLRYVPLSIMDAPLVEAALLSNAWAIEYVPADFSHLPSVQAVIEDPAVPDAIKDHLRDPQFHASNGVIGRLRS